MAFLVRLSIEAVDLAAVLEKLDGMGVYRRLR